MSEEKSDSSQQIEEHQKQNYEVKADMISSTCAGVKSKEETAALDFTQVNENSARHDHQDDSEGGENGEIDDSEDASEEYLQIRVLRQHARDMSSKGAIIAFVDIVMNCFNLGDLQAAEELYARCLDIVSIYNIPIV